MQTYDLIGQRGCMGDSNFKLIQQAVVAVLTMPEL